MSGVSKLCRPLPRRSLCRMTSPPDPTPLSIVAAAADLGVSKWTVRRLIRAGALEAHKIGPGRTSALVITPAELDRYRGVMADGGAR